MIEKKRSKYYGETAAVDGSSFDVAPGVVTGFLGPNGAGKSTTTRVILGLGHPSVGSATTALIAWAAVLLVVAYVSLVSRDA